MMVGACTTSHEMGVRARGGWAGAPRAERREQLCSAVPPPVCRDLECPPLHSAQQAEEGLSREGRTLLTHQEAQPAEPLSSPHLGP